MLRRRLIDLFTSACRCFPLILPARVHCCSHLRQELCCNHLYWHPRRCLVLHCHHHTYQGKLISILLAPWARCAFLSMLRNVLPTPEQYDASPSGHSAGVCAGGSWQHNVESDGCSYQRCRREPSGGHDAGARHAVPALTPGVTRFCRTSKPGCFSDSLRNSSFSRSLWEFLLGWPSQYPHTCFFHQRMSSVAMKCPPPQRLHG